MKNEIEIENVDPPDAQADPAALAAENADLKNAIRMHHARDSVIRCLRAANARSPELMFESAKARLQFGEDGELLNAAAIVAQMAAEFPEQFGAGRPASIDGGAGVVQPPPLTRAALAKMSTAEIAALDWNDVKRALKE